MKEFKLYWVVHEIPLSEQSVMLALTLVKSKPCSARNQGLHTSQQC